MNTTKFMLFLLLSLLFFGCTTQRLDKNDLVVKEFNWRVKIPDFMITQNQEEWKRLQNLGMEKINDTYGTHSSNKAETIFIFKSKDESFFEATTEAHKSEIYYALTCQRMDDIFYNTLKTQIPNGKIDTAKSVVTVDNRPFQTLTSSIVYSSGNIAHAVIFRSLFKGKELTVSVMFSNQQTGDRIIEAFKSSSFNWEQ
jgi:hypothetical protein